MKNVRGERWEDVVEGEISPEGVNRLQAILGKCLWWIAICSKVESLDHVFRISEWWGYGIPKVVGCDKTLWTSVLLATSYETLFRVISNVCCENRMDTMIFPIGTNHHDTCLSSLNQRFQQGLHTLVEEIVSFDSTFFLIKTLEFCDWEVAKQNCCTFWLFVTSVLANVPNGGIHRPPLFIASKPRKVCLVWGYVDWWYCRTGRKFPLKMFQICQSDFVMQEYLNASTCLSLPPPISCHHLTVYSILQLIILIMLLWCIFHPILEHWVPNQPTHTLNRIPSPELNFLNNRVAILIQAVSSDFEDFAHPLWAFRGMLIFLKNVCLFWADGQAPDWILIKVQHHEINTNTSAYQLQF